MSESTLNGGSLTREQIEFYDREGYLVLPDLLNDADLDDARKAMTQKVDEIAGRLVEAGLITDKLEHRPFERRLAELFTGLTDKDFLQFGRSWRDRFPGYFRLMSNPKILDAVQSLIGPELFANPVYNTRPKIPQIAAGAVPWHQDKSYWPNANWNPVITVWIPVVDSTEENGCLHVWPRTHKTQLMDHGHEGYSGTGFLAIDVGEKGRREAVPLPLKAGGAILFNDRCVHMSTPNNSDRIRWSVDLRYQPTDQDPMIKYGVGFLARSHKHPQRVATLEDWLANRPERLPDGVLSA